MLATTHLTKLTLELFFHRKILPRKATKHQQEIMIHMTGIT
jgi:hypothetical protein